MASFTQGLEDRLNGYFLLNAVAIMAKPMIINNPAQKNLANPRTMDQRLQNGQNQGATCSSAQITPRTTKPRPTSSKTAAPMFT